jgi:chromosome segregation ATPase
MTKENICECVEAKNKLEELGLSFGNVDEVTNIIQNTRALGNDPAKVANIFASTSSLQTRKERLEKDIQYNEETIKNMMERMRMTSAELAKLEGLKRFLDRFVGLGFNESMLERLLQVIKQVASDRGIPLNMAAAALLTEIETSYNTLFGFRATVDKLKENMKVADAELLRTKTEHAELKGAIVSLTFLGVKGIKENDLIYWQKVFRDYPKLTPQMLTECLRDYADLKEALVSMEEQRRQSEAKLEKLNLEIDSLQKQKTKAEEDLARTKRTMEGEMKDMTGKIEKLREDQQKLLTKMALDVIQETSKKAFLEALSLTVKPSVLQPIIRSENGGAIPKSGEIIAASIYLIHMVNGITPISDPIKADLERMEAALKSKIF